MVDVPVNQEIIVQETTGSNKDQNPPIPVLFMETEKLLQEIQT